MPLGKYYGDIVNWSDNNNANRVNQIIREIDESAIQSSDVTYEALAANGDVGTSAGQVAIGDHTHANLPTDAQKAALAGGADSSAAPSGTNVYITNDDTRLTGGSYIVGSGTYTGGNANQDVALTFTPKYVSMYFEGKVNGGIGHGFGDGTNNKCFSTAALSLGIKDNIVYTTDGQATVTFAANKFTLAWTGATNGVDYIYSAQS